jgi:hypothetical protein
MELRTRGWTGLGVRDAARASLLGLRASLLGSLPVLQGIDFIESWGLIDASAAAAAFGVCTRTDGSGSERTFALPAQAGVGSVTDLAGAAWDCDYMRTRTVRAGFTSV